MVSIDGAGSRYALMVTPVAGYGLGRPVVSADGNTLILSFAAPIQQGQQSYSRNLSVPGSVPYPEPVPPLQPRAVAPPVGDMAVGSMLLRNSGFVNASGPPVTMTLSNAPAQAALMSLARMGGYGFVYVNDSPAQASQGSGNAGTGSGAAPSGGAARPNPVSISFRNENYSRALNSTLLAAGLQGKLEGNTLLVGTNVLGKTFGAQLSKVYRLNQVAANSAADYLANLGAQVTKTNTITTAVSAGVASTAAPAGSSTASTTTSSTTTTVQSFGASTGPLLGLQATTDSRLSTITLVGSPAVVAVAEQYLKQLDVRQRQVALSVKILDVTLNNDTSIDNSFAFRFGNNFIVNDQGQMLANFGALKPPSSAESGLPGRFDGVTGSPLVGVGGFRLPGSNPGQFFLTPQANSGISAPGSATPFYNPSYPTRPGFGTFANPGQAGAVEFTPSTTTRTTTSTIDPDTGFPTITSSATTLPDTIKYGNPTAFQYPANQFFDFVKAAIISSSTKVLASPTLILSENSEELRKGDDQSAVLQTSGGSNGSSGSGGSGGAGGGATNLATIGRTKANESFVTVGEQVITNYTVTTGTQGNGNSCQPQFGIAGLTFGARISKIDDNGFVTFSMSPSITAKVNSIPVQGCGPIDVLAIRRLDTGSARVRDGQTLILTGVISDRDTEVVQKWPILGDMPLIGQFFRSSGGNRAKRELVILVTPRIIDDTQGGGWGYGYQPTSRDTRRFLGNGSAPSPY
ncbi:MAG: type II secretion system protein GspD [Cyanobium sp.]